MVAKFFKRSDEKTQTKVRAFVMSKANVHSLICKALLPLSAILTFVLLAGNDLINRSFSAIGRDNPWLHITFCLVSAAAFWFNMKLLLSRLQMNHKAFEVIAFIAVTGHVASALTLESTPFWITMHVMTSLIFIVFGFSLLIVAFAVKAVRHPSRIPYTSIFIVGLGTVAIGLIAHGTVAFWQAIGITLLFALVFSANHIEKWDCQPSFSFNADEAEATIDSSIDMFDI